MGGTFVLTAPRKRWSHPKAEPPDPDQGPLNQNVYLPRTPITRGMPSEPRLTNGSEAVMFVM